MNNNSSFSLRIDLHRLAFGLLWLFIFSVPWEEEAVLPQHMAMSHIVGAAVAVFGLLACIQRKRVRRLQTAHYLAAALVCWAALSYNWSIAPDLTSVRVASYAQLLFMVWLIWEFAGSAERQTSLLAAYVLGAWVAALSTIYQFVTGTGRNPGVIDGRYTSGANENELGIILALGLGMACYLLGTAKRFRAVWLVSVPVLLVGILLTGSRGSMISTGIAFLLFPLSIGRFSRSVKVTGGIALLAMMGAGALLLPATTWDRVQSIPEELSKGTLTKRTYIWAAGREVYREHPIVGVGAGAFEASVYRQLDIAYVAHNSYLSVLVELGAVGLILFVTLLAALASSAWNMPKPARSAWIILLLTWAVAVSSVTWEHRKPTWFIFAMVIAQAAALKSRRVRGGVVEAAVVSGPRLRVA
jgi:O-antigen ligase